MKSYEWLDKIKETGLISRAEAIQIDKEFDGLISNRVHINSFTEIPSDTNVDIVISLLNKIYGEEYITLTTVEAKNLVDTLLKTLNKIEKLSLSHMNPILLVDVLNCNKKEIHNICIKDLTIAQMIEYHDELVDLFGHSISIVKLKNDYEEIKGLDLDKKFGFYIDNREINKVILLLKDAIKNIQNNIMSDVVIKIDPRSVTYFTIKQHSNKIIISAMEYTRALLAP